MSVRSLPGASYVRRFENVMVARIRWVHGFRYLDAECCFAGNVIWTAQERCVCEVEA
jgi:hypothetical protein